MNFRCFYDFQGMIIFYDYYCVASVVLLRNNYGCEMESYSTFERYKRQTILN